MGPFDNWPTGSGFEYFYGFIGGEAHQYYPSLYEGTTAIEPTKTPEEGYHLTGRHDRQDDQLDRVSRRRSWPTSPSSSTSRRAPPTRRTTCPRTGSTSTRASSTTAGSALREQTFARQKELGVIPHDAKLTERPEEIPAWDEMPEELKPVLRAADGDLRRVSRLHRPPRRARAGHARGSRDPREHARLLHHRRQRRLCGGNAERDVQRDRSTSTGPQRSRLRSSWLARLDDFGGPESYNHFAVGWAHAMCTPYQWTKQVASHWGGTRNGTIVHWPAGTKKTGEVRSQFHHVIDIAPTVLEAAGLPHPTSVKWRPAGAAPRRAAWRIRSATETRPSGTRRSTSRCSATAGSTTRARPPSPSTRRRG